MKFYYLTMPRRSAGTAGPETAARKWTSCCKLPSASISSKSCPLHHFTKMTKPPFEILALSPFMRSLHSFGKPTAVGVPMMVSV